MLKQWRQTKVAFTPPLSIPLTPPHSQINTSLLIDGSNSKPSTSRTRQRLIYSPVILKTTAQGSSALSYLTSESLHLVLSSSHRSVSSLIVAAVAQTDEGEGIGSGRITMWANSIPPSHHHSRLSASSSWCTRQISRFVIHTLFFKRLKGTKPLFDWYEWCLVSFCCSVCGVFGVWPD